jgi:hypothetical protein
MPISIAASNSQTVDLLATDYALATQTSPTGGAIYQLRVDAANLVNGERVTLTLRTRARSGDSERVLYQSTFENVQGEPLKDSPAIAVQATVDVVAILRQDGGTGRAFPWALIRLDG